MIILLNCALTNATKDENEVINQKQGFMDVWRQKHFVMLGSVVWPAEKDQLQGKPLLPFPSMFPYVCYSPHPGRAPCGMWNSTLVVPAPCLWLFRCWGPDPNQHPRRLLPHTVCSQAEQTPLRLRVLFRAVRGFGGYSFLKKQRMQVQGGG